MKFVLTLWPDLPDDTPPEALLGYALGSIEGNPGLVWDIYSDDGALIAADVKEED